MDSIGRLAGGLAHDFNNILGGIVGAASVAARAVERVPEEHRDRLARQIEAIREAGWSARDVVKKLLDFSRSPLAVTRRFSLAQVLSDVETLCRKTFGESPALDATCTAEGDPAIEGDEGGLKQALLSLCLNAGDAVGRGGRISLRVEVAPSTRSFYASHPDANPEVPYLCVVLEGRGAGDQGVVLPAQSALAALARQHRGFVDTGALPGGAACVRLYLPRAAEAAP